METLFIAPGESTMAALGRTELTEAVAAAPRKCEEEEEEEGGMDGREETDEEGDERGGPEIQTDT